VSTISVGYDKEIYLPITSCNYEPLVLRGVKCSIHGQNHWISLGKITRAK